MPDGFPSDSASGVIISSDGLILSQYHVSHMVGVYGIGTKGCQPGERTMVALADGRELEAELRGADQTHDLSLLQLLAPGPYSYVPLIRSVTVNRGEWVLKLGHPLGYRIGRATVARLGRVLFQDKELFVADCMIWSGDSGGPYFDLDGQLVGIVNETMPPDKSRFSANLGAKAGQYDCYPTSATTAALVAQQLEFMRENVIINYDQKVYEQFHEPLLARRVSSRDDWTQGAATLKALQTLAGSFRSSVVSILNEKNEVVALGTAADPNAILTVASRLPDAPRCQLTDGRIIPARFVGADSTFDVALVRLPLNLSRCYKSGHEGTYGSPHG